MSTPIQTVIQAQSPIQVLLVDGDQTQVIVSTTGPQGADGGGGGGGGSGTVTSVAVSGGTTGLTTSGGPVTASGTITLAGTLAVANGGTGSGVAATGLANLGGVPSTRLVSAGTGLSGGGDLSADRTLSVAYGTTGTTACVGNDSRLSDARTPTAHTHPQSEVTSLVSDLAAKAPTSRLISSGTGLTGGGDLSADRTLAVSYGTTAGTACQGNDSRLSDSRAPSGSAGGDLTGTYPNPTVANDAVSNSKLANMTASTIKARKTASTGDPEDCTLSEVLDLVGSAAQGDILYRGASSWTRLGAGTSGHYLQTQGAAANPQWAAVSGGGYYTVGLESSILFTSPADSTTYYPAITNLRTVATQGEVRVPVAGTVIEYWVRVAVTGTVGSGESVNYYLRKNDTTDGGNFTGTWNAAAGYQEYSSGTISISVAAGDKLALKMVTPAWATNPTSVLVQWYAIIQT